MNTNHRNLCTYMHILEKFSTLKGSGVYISVTIPYMSTTTHENKKMIRIQNLFRKTMLIFFLISLGKTLFKIVTVELQ